MEIQSGELILNRIQQERLLDNVNGNINIMFGNELVATEITRLFNKYVQEIDKTTLSKEERLIKIKKSLKYRRFNRIC